MLFKCQASFWLVQKSSGWCTSRTVGKWNSIKQLFVLILFFFISHKNSFIDWPALRKESIYQSISAIGKESIYQLAASIPPGGSTYWLANPIGKKSTYRSASSIPGEESTYQAISSISKKSIYIRNLPTFQSVQPHIFAVELQRSSCKSTKRRKLPKKVLKWHNNSQ